MSAGRSKRMSRHHKRQKKVSSLNLTSLMDIFTILVFFLLVNSSEVEVLQTNKNIELPKSIAEKRPDNNLVVTISAEDIVVQGRRVVSVPEVNQSSSLLIEELDKELDYQRSRRPKLSEKEKVKGRSITIMGDKNVPYQLLKRVMSTCAQADFRDISLAVSKKEVADPDGLEEG